MKINVLLVFIAVLSKGDSRHIGELVCRQCGMSITRQSELINSTGVDEKYVKYKYDFPIVGKNITVNVLNNPSGEYFHVFASKTAHLKFHGVAQSDATWFPGMKWTICVCKSCGKHMGWYFQPEYMSSSENPSFVGLILDKLISADYVDTLTKTP